MTRPFSFALLAGALTLSIPAAARAQNSTPRVGVCFYEDADYRGNYFCATPGEEKPSVEDMNDRISSIRVFGGAQVEVFKDIDYKGTARRISGSVPNLGDLNDEVSSFRVVGTRGYNNSRYGNNRYGNTNQYGNNANPDRIVRRAYQDILNRDPDPEGMRLYRSKIIDEGWSEADVRDSLRNSDEYRQNGGRDVRSGVARSRAQDIVRRAYLNVLQREPDPAAASWVDRVMNDGLTQADVERELRKSEEYRRRR
jgi:hypothetical protein